MSSPSQVLRDQAIQLAEELHEKLATALGESVGVILFGSQARGEASDESDVDVLVVLPDLEKSTLDTALDIAWEVGFEAGKVISVVPAASDELELLSASPFFRAVQREGIPV
jgi:predicted nucleotidyltransferase